MSGGRWIVVALVFTVIGAGCGQSKFKPTYPASGQVLLNGKPVAGVKVVLVSQDDKDDPLLRPTGNTDDEGRFVLSTYAKDDGAPAGSYTATIVTPLPEPKPGQKRPAEPTSKVPVRYGKPETSGLTIVVEPKDNEISPLNLTK